METVCRTWLVSFQLSKACLNQVQLCLSNFEFHILQDIVPRAQRYVDTAEAARRKKQKALHNEWEQGVFQKIQVCARLFLTMLTGPYQMGPAVGD